MNREDLELYVTGNFDGDVAALERALADDPALAEAVADEARFEMLLRDAAVAATFCAACEDVVRGERCDACGAAVRPGGYTIERVLVSNAHGRMYVAHDADGKQVALKELAFVQAPPTSTIEAFEREAKFLRALEHPAIPRFVASFEEGRGVHTRYYLAQELVVGTSLDRLDQKWYSEAEIVDIARQVLAILVYLQSLSPMVIHRDIKPANLVRRTDGSIAIVDFGAAYVDGSTAGVTTIGTFGYMPVEQLAGIVDATTDSYALGSSLLYLLTRQEPWRLAQTKTAVNVSAPLRAFLDMLTANDPRERFASAKDALIALDRRDELVPKQAHPAWLRVAVIGAAALALTGTGIAVVSYARDSSVDVEKPTPAPAGIATLRIAMPRNMTAELSIDDNPVASVHDGSELPISAGRRRVKIENGAGARCEQELTIAAGKITTIECLLATVRVPPETRLDNTTSVTWSYQALPFHDAMTNSAKACGLNIVVPDHLDTKVTAQLTAVPCNEALETILEAQGLWYVYDKGANLVRVGSRRALDAERDEAAARPPSTHKRLPPSTQKLDMEFKRAPLRDLLPMLTVGVGKMNLVIPEGIDAKTTIHLKDVPWDRAFEGVLEAHGLWYRYREEGKIIRIAPRRQLDADDDEARARGR